MGQILVRKIADDTISAYKDAAKRHGRSLEAELREVIESAKPRRAKNCEELGALSRRLSAMTLPDGPDGSDSTLGIRWDRDTDHGRWIDDGWADHLAGR